MDIKKHSTVYLSKSEFHNKPTPTDIKYISSSIMGDIYTVTDLEDFAVELSEKGRSVVLAKFTLNKLSKSSPISHQKFFMLDFDNKNKFNQYTIEDLKADDWMLNNACFYYKTFSDSKSNVDKFRVVFQLDEACQVTEEVERIYEELFKKYPQSDTSVGQTSRIFFGSNQGYEEINFDNTLKINTLTEENFNKDLAYFQSNNIIDINTPNYLLLKYRKFDLLQEKYGNNYSLEFVDNISAMYYFSSVDIKEFLELPEENPFLDILHEEKNPSASVFFDKNVDTWYYKVFSEQHKFVGDVVSVVRVLLKLTDTIEAVKVLLEVTNSQIVLNSKLHREKENSEVFRKELLSGRLNNIAPELFKILNRYKYEINALLDTFYDYTYTDTTNGEVRFLNYISTDKLTQIVNQKLPKKISTQKLATIVNILVTVEMISKLNLDEVPVDLITEIIDKQEQDGRHFRLSNFFETNDLGTSFIGKFNSVAKVLVDSQLPVSGLSFESIYRLYGEDKANEVFPQSRQPLIERNMIHLDKDDNNLTKKSVKWENHCSKIILNAIENDGYIYEDEVIRQLSRKIKKSIVATKKIFEQMRHDILSKYEIKRVRNSRELYEKYKMKGKYSSKTIFTY